MKTVIGMIIVAAAFSGCSHAPAKKAATVAMADVSAGVPSRTAPALPPSMVAQAPVIAESAAPAVSFINQAKYRKVVLRGYIDEKGRAISPQEIVQEVQAGGINPDAIDNWDRAYIPAQNVLVPAGMGSPVMATVPQVVAPDSDLIAKNPEETIVTGYYRPEDAALVDSMARESGRVKHLDSNLGWVLLKK